MAVFRAQALTAVGARLNRFTPLGVGEVPLDSLAQPACQVVGGPPPQLVMVELGPPYA